MTEPGWRWDATLYAGAARYYAEGRVPYPATLVDALVAELGLDGSGRLLDLGCGPGSLALLLAPHVAGVTAVDADEHMLAEGRRGAAVAGIGNVEWVHARAEELTADLGVFAVAALAQSFHWMDRPRVAELVRGLLSADGALVHVHAATHEGVDSDVVLPHPRPPRREIDALVTAYLGPRRRAGRGHRDKVMTGEAAPGEQEAEIYRAAGFGRAVRLEVPGWIVTRSADQVVASVFSLSYAAPHLFGDRLVEFERDLRRLLLEASPDGVFSEQMREVAADIWRA